MRIDVVTPVTGIVRGPAEPQRYVTGTDTELRFSNIDYGPASIECAYDIALAVPPLLDKIKEVVGQGSDAVVIDCFGGPGAEAAREVVDIPVINPGEVAMHAASMLGHRFSILTIAQSLIPTAEGRCRSYGLREKLASIRSIDIPVLELEDDQDRLVAALFDAGVKAIEHDGAHVLIPGCLGIGVSPQLEALLAARGYGGVVVIDAYPLALRYAELAAVLRLRHSKRTYATPATKVRTERPVATRA